MGFVGVNTSTVHWCVCWKDYLESRWSECLLAHREDHSCRYVCTYLHTPWTTARCVYRCTIYLDARWSGQFSKKTSITVTVHHSLGDGVPFLIIIVKDYPMIAFRNLDLLLPIETLKGNSSWGKYSEACVHLVHVPCTTQCYTLWCYCSACAKNKVILISLVIYIIPYAKNYQIWKSPRHASYRYHMHC